MRSIARILLLAFCCLCALTCEALAREGLREILAARSKERSAWRHQESVETATIAGLTVSIWRPATGAGPAPLVLFSHGLHGNGQQSKFLTKALADAGYLVLAPNHRDAVVANLRDGFQWKPDEPLGNADKWTDATYQDRAEDLRRLLEALRVNKRWSSTIDWRRLGLVGHSLGGYTVLGLAGAWPAWKQPGVAAVVALSPYANPYLRTGRLDAVTVPVQYQGGTLDLGVTPFLTMREGAFERTPSPAHLVVFERAGHFAWTDLNSRFSSSIIHYTRAFLDRYVKGDSNADLTTRLENVVQIRAK